MRLQVQTVVEAKVVQNRAREVARVVHAMLGIAAVMLEQVERHNHVLGEELASGEACVP